MISAVRDRASDQLLLYQNAALLATVEDATWSISNDADMYWATTAAQADFFNGALDEVSIYNYALNADEIQTLYQNYATDIQRDENPFVPQNLSLASYPNPFNSRTMISYTIPKQDHVHMAIYNSLGQQVDVLLNEDKPAGRYTLNYETSHLSSSVYIVRIQAGAESTMKKILLLR
jgi:hypothetical protein